LFWSFRTLFCRHRTLFCRHRTLLRRFRTLFWSHCTCFGVGARFGEVRTIRVSGWININLSIDPPA
jgi:hypothetical protein